MKIQSILVAAAVAAISTAAMADTGSKAIQLTDAQLAKLTAAGSIMVENRDRTITQYNQGVEGTYMIQSQRQTTVCKPASLCSNPG